MHIHAVKIKSQTDNAGVLSPFTPDSAEEAFIFHKSFPEYAETPLVSLHNLADSIGIDSLHVKDESPRFGLNAFKVLGGSYAIGKYIAEKAGLYELSYDSVKSENTLGEITFVTATDGNHGRAVAWTANKLGKKSVVYLPRGSSRERLDNILSLGADASITELSYDDAVRLASENAVKHGWVLIQDTELEGYGNVTRHIMQGYTTSAREAVSQLGDTVPTHVFLQAGVGSFAGAIAAFLSEYYGKRKPIIIIVEPDSADCVYQTAKAADGVLHCASGDLNTIMAGLSCGEVCRAAWEILRCCADFSVTVPDSIAQIGMRTLAYPSYNDEKIISGESGAVTVGLVCELMKNPILAPVRDMLSLDSSSRILCFSTEGDTDKESYNNIISKGKPY